MSHTVTLAMKSRSDGEQHDGEGKIGKAAHTAQPQSKKTFLRP